MTASDAGRLWRYGVLGIASNGFCYLVFLGLLRLRTPPVAANALCYCLGLTISYLGNRRWTFRSENRHLSDMMRFGAAYAGGFGVSVASMAFFVRLIPAAIAQIATVAITAMFIFAALTLLRFGQPSHAGTGERTACR